MADRLSIKRGTVVFVKDVNDSSTGHVMKGKHPAVVVQLRLENVEKVDVVIRFSQGLKRKYDRFDWYYGCFEKWKTIVLKLYNKMYCIELFCNILKFLIILLQCLCGL